MSYQSQRPGLLRELKRIKSTRQAALKKKRQVSFVKAISEKVLGGNPFTVIEVGTLSRQRKQVGNKVVASKTLGETEWVSGDRGKGIRVTLDKVVFNDPLESIVNTVFHESVHAQQLKNGIPYQKFAMRGRAKYFYDAVVALCEVDAYLLEVNSPYTAMLAAERRKSAKASLAEAEKEAKQDLEKLNMDMLLPYQKKLEALLPKFAGIKKFGWLGKNPLPWKRKASAR